ncbi:MAG: RNA-protein complex protein Nop10 [Methanomassiliicoccales archaeon]
MRTLIRRCPKCGRYTLADACPEDRTQTRNTAPPRYSPQDRYAKYRRALMEKLKEEGVTDARH